MLVLATFGVANVGARSAGAADAVDVTQAAAAGSRALRFGGSGVAAPGADRVLIPVEPPTAADLGATDFTIELWLAGTVADNPGAAVVCDVPGYTWMRGRAVVDRDRWPGLSADGRDFGASVTSDGRLAFGVQNGAGQAWTTCTAGVNVLDGAWHHVALERAVGGPMTIWVDGQRRAAATGPAGDVSYPDGAATERHGTDPFLAIGADKLDAGAALPSFRGLVDEVRLSTSLRYAAAFLRPTGPFVPDAATAALYHFDGSTGLCPAVLPDAAGHVNARCIAAAPGPTLVTTVPPFRVAPAPQAPPAAPAGTSSFHPIAPVRLTDTRPTPLNGGEVLEVQVSGVGGIPTAATSVALNLTVANPHGLGFLTAWACGQSPPGTSNLNFVAGETVANFAAVNIGSGGRVCVSSPATTHVIVDATGWWGTGGLGYGAVLPTRLIDTRPARYGYGHVVEVQVTGRAGIPANAQAASINLTATGTAGVGWFTVWPCGQPQPGTSNVNFVGGQSVANVAAVALGTGGTLCVATSTVASVIVDVTGWWGPVGLAHVQPGLSPTRLLDTRPAGVAAGAVVGVPIPAGVAIATLNLTVTGPAGPGWVIAWPCGQAAPTTSNLNFAAGQTVAGSALVPPGPDGRVCIQVTAKANLIVDVFGAMVLPNVAQQAIGGRLYALQWGYTQLGAPYAGVNPYRFGDSTWGKRWDCPSGWTSCAKIDILGKARAAEPGDFVYDCSGFVVAAFQRAGVDLVKLNAAWSDMMFKSLPRVASTDLQTGDLLLFGPGDANPNDPTTHVGMYLGANQMLNSTAGCANGGVCTSTVDWTRVTAIARPPFAGAPTPTQEGPIDPYAGAE